MTSPTAIPSLPPTREQTINDERIINLGSMILVASKSERGVWHEVTDGRCDCLGFVYRQACRHIETARLVTEQDRETATPAAMYPSTCPPNKEPWLLEPDACSDCSIKPAKIGGRCLLCNAKYLDRE